jgi:hypothetical protein
MPSDKAWRRLGAGAPVTVMTATSPQSELPDHRAVSSLAAARREPSITADRATGTIQATLRDSPFGTDGKRFKVRAASMGRNRLTSRDDERGRKPQMTRSFRFPPFRSQFGRETFAYLN